VIVSFGDQPIEDLFHGAHSKQARKLPPDVARVAVRKLDMLNAAKSVRDLQSPPGNRLEALRGRLRSFYSIRINDQWRVIFRWIGSDAHDVRVTDYH
jgi:proteic killer suppression protein